MKMKTFSQIGLVFVIAILGAGCSNTSEGLSKDAQADSKMGAKSAADAVESATKTTRDVTAAVSLTPAIKLAITGDSNLNIPDNHIDVDTDETRVKLMGTVVSASDKDRAQQIAAQILKDHKSPQKLENDIQVQAPAKGEKS